MGDVLAIHLRKHGCSQTNRLRTKELTRIALGSVAGALLGSVAFLGLESAAPRAADAEVRSDARHNITDIKKHSQPGVYMLSYNFYRVDSQGRQLPDSVIPIVQLVNCRNATAATYNTETGRLQILPLRKTSLVGKFCTKAYGWYGN